MSSSYKKIFLVEGGRWKRSICLLFYWELYQSDNKGIGFTMTGWGLWANERFQPKSLRQKVVRGAVISITGGGCSQWSGKQPVCPGEPWWGSEDWKGDVVLKTDGLFEKWRKEQCTLYPTTTADLESGSLSEANTAVLLSPYVNVACYWISYME